jgi:hypothetical protein
MDSLARKGYVPGTGSLLVPVRHEKRAHVRNSTDDAVMYLKYVQYRYRTVRNNKKSAKRRRGRGGGLLSSVPQSSCQSSYQ